MDAKKDTKQLIIETAFNILLSRGGDALTTNTLIEEASISKGGLYHHFKDIEGVYLAVLEMLADTLTEGFYELEFTDVDHLNEVMIETIFDEIEAYQQVYIALFYYISNAVNKPEYKERLEKWSDDSLRNWSSLYTQFSNDKISEEKMDSAIRMVDMYFGGLIIHNFLADDIPKYKKITREFMNMISLYLNLK